MLTPLAERGNAEAQTLLGLMYSRGSGVSKEPGGCLDLDTIICAEAFLREDCDPALLTGAQQYTLVGHINVDRSRGKPKWENVTRRAARLLHLRFKSCD